jgi:hypothetical protein
MARHGVIPDPTVEKHVWQPPPLPPPPASPHTHRQQSRISWHQLLLLVGRDFDASTVEVQMWWHSTAKPRLVWCLVTYPVVTGAHYSALPDGKSDQHGTMRDSQGQLLQEDSSASQLNCLS